ncbi:MAG TPA: type I restriction-modification system subunit M N-terminal domain-containing protein [Candidatus Didemnitutus sp.]|jgi:type I restriction enzyme M protein
MLNGDIRSKIDALWNAFWTGGISNPLEVIEQITYLLFLKRLERRVFPDGKDGIGKGGGRAYEDLRWSRFKNLEPKEMFEVVDQHVFPFLRTLGGDGSKRWAAQRR